MPFTVFLAASVAQSTNAFMDFWVSWMLYCCSTPIDSESRHPAVEPAKKKTWEMTGQKKWRQKFVFFYNRISVKFLASWKTGRKWTRKEEEKYKDFKWDWNLENDILKTAFGYYSERTKCRLWLKWSLMVLNFQNDRMPCADDSPSSNT